MEHAPAENSTSDVDHHVADTASHLSNHDDTESTCDIAFGEIISIMEVIAATGKFWHDWNILKSLLSFRLKQVLAEYPEAEFVSGDGPQQSSLSGETYPELVKRLDEALLSFTEGPPFTLQRLCEILLNPKGTYRSISKLALALDKNLLVTSTLTMCTEPYPRPSSPKSGEPDGVTEESKGHSAAVSNGVETKAGDGDEEMVEAEADEDAPIADAEVQDAAQNADTKAGARIGDTEAQGADTEIHRDADTEIHTQVADSELQDAAQNADTEIHSRVADAEIHDASQNADTEMQEVKANDASESNPEPSSESDPGREPCTTSTQNPPAEQP